MVDIGGNARGVWMAGWEVDGGWRGAHGGGEGSGGVVVVVVAAVAGCTEARSRKQTHRSLCTPSFLGQSQTYNGVTRRRFGYRVLIRDCSPVIGLHSQRLRYAPTKHNRFDIQGTTIPRW